MLLELGDREREKERKVELDRDFLFCGGVYGAVIKKTTHLCHFHAFSFLSFFFAFLIVNTQNYHGSTKDIKKCSWKVEKNSGDYFDILQ
jgi:hypothetical protein